MEINKLLTTSQSQAITENLDTSKDKGLLKPQIYNFSTSKKSNNNIIHNSKNNIKKNNNISIDEKHTLLMNEFYKIENETIPNLKKIKIKLKKKINDLNEDNLDERILIYNKIKKIKEEIKQLKNKKKKYLLENSIFIFNYFEEKKNIALNHNKLIEEDDSKKNSKKKIINSFFKIKKTENSNINNNEKTQEIYIEKHKNLNNYWSNVNNQILNIQDFITAIDICQKCNNGELIPQEDEGILICNNCGVFVQHIIDCEKPSYKEPPSEVSYTAYLRLNHFKEILSQFQAKETTQIPDEVIEDIRNRIKKERITDLSEITYTKTRDILRKLGYNKYFEHIQYINCKFGIKPPTMSEELIETLCVLFIEIQGPWAIHCPSTRTNFFNYAYTLFQLCKLLDQTQFLPFIPMMKDAEKGKEQDTIWQKVCQELDWYFYPSV